MPRLIVPRVPGGLRMTDMSIDEEWTSPDVLCASARRELSLAQEKGEIRRVTGTLHEGVHSHQRVGVHCEKNVSKRTRIYGAATVRRTLGRDDVDACVDEVVRH